MSVQLVGEMLKLSLLLSLVFSLTLLRLANRVFRSLFLFAFILCFCTIAFLDLRIHTYIFWNINFCEFLVDKVGSQIEIKSEINGCKPQTSRDPFYK